jgi:hypothetical protein
MRHGRVEEDKYINLIQSTSLQHKHFSAPNDLTAQAVEHKQSRQKSKNVPQSHQRSISIKRFIRIISQAKSIANAAAHTSI